MKWIFAAFCLISSALSTYCFRVSSDAQKVVDAVNGPPLFQVPVDFSRPFTNEVAFRHSVQPFYGKVYLTLRVDPPPKNWNTLETASEQMRAVDGAMYVISSNNTPSEKRRLDWSYYIPLRSEPEIAQAFFGRLPLGDYRLIIATKAGVADVEGAKQELILRYDMIHEGSISRVLRTLSIVFTIGAVLSGAAAFWFHRKHPGSQPTTLNPNRSRTL